MTNTQPKTAQLEINQKAVSKLKMWTMKMMEMIVMMMLITSLMFLKEKRDGRLKVRACANGIKQRT